MPLQRETVLGCLLLLWVPLLARRLRGLPGFGARHPVDVAFYAAAVLLAWLVPRGAGQGSWATSAAGWFAVLTVVASAALGLLYVALVPEARRVAVRLLSVLVVVDVAALAVIHASVAGGLGLQAYALTLVLVTGTAAYGSAWAAVRIGSQSRR